MHPKMTFCRETFLFFYHILTFRFARKPHFMMTIFSFLKEVRNNLSEYLKDIYYILQLGDEQNTRLK